MPPGNSSFIGTNGQRGLPSLPAHTRGALVGASGETENGEGAMPPFVHEQFCSLVFYYCVITEDSSFPACFMQVSGSHDGVLRALQRHKHAKYTTHPVLVLLRVGFRYEKKGQKIKR